MPQQQLVARVRRSLRPARHLPAGTLFGVSAAIVAVVAIASLTYFSLLARSEAADRVERVQQSQDVVENVRATLASAEAGQRGYLLTNDDQYLEPFTRAESALAADFEQLRNQLAGNADQLRRLDMVADLAREKLEEMAKTVDLQRSGNGPGALALVGTDRGKFLMDRIRETTGEILQDERAALARHQQEWRDAAELSTIVTWSGSALLLVLILIAAVVMARQFRAREEQAWLRGGRAEFGVRILGEQNVATLADHALTFLVDYLGARVGVVYVSTGDGQFERSAGHALEPSTARKVVRRGEGVVGQAIADMRPVKIEQVPERYMPVSSGVGDSEPRQVLVVPAVADGEVQAVVELGFFREVQALDEELVASISEALAYAVRALLDRKRLVGLLEETQRQAEELQAQQEELRVNNEELEEHARALKESQARLELQQVEMEQANSQLEEQTQVLEIQKEELSQAKMVLMDRAAELQRANRYKGEFLANMSHELRTPLNSALILAKLLADNRDGNLSDEQIEYAQTIYSAGNDLLVLINDILDLSRIESGKIVVETESVDVDGLLEGLRRVHDPIAKHKGLALDLRVEDGASKQIVTDGRRLGQILRNLLSNALKFTEKGSVSLVVRNAVGNRIAFVVRDTGIGITDEQQDVIFEAFRQADGGTHRKYGGTGLGLTISRDLARLLGGDIEVASRPGAGSEFTLTLPIQYAPVEVTRSDAPRPSPPKEVRETQRDFIPRRPSAESPELDGEVDPAAVADDRARVVPGSRTLVIIEDDTRFAQILRDLAREQGFLCIVTQSAEAGLRAATKYAPSAILLDMNLPDRSGMGVLEQLKRNSRTRHVPVHVLSVADYAQEAMELGAIGYALKPVAREQLLEVLDRLETKIAQQLRRVLIVEDDERQRHSIQLLLRGDGVELTAVASASEALERLKVTTFDCMVMDLNLPDLSGYELLERMVGQDGVSFPPVIVYTGGALKRDEEQRLRRFARSIIIKDARSPERLLDEVTLFLHQVESTMPAERQQMLRVARNREGALEGRRVLVVEDDVRNIFALSRVLEPKGITVEIARNGREALEVLDRRTASGDDAIDLVLMDIMMPEMDGFTAMREIRKRPECSKLPIIALTAKAMPNDQEQCMAAGASDYIAKPLDIDKLLSLIRVWMPK